jgi:excisionase family DNA binding protein
VSIMPSRHAGGNPENAGSSGPPLDNVSTAFRPLLVSVDEARRMIGLGRTKLFELIASGKLRVVKIGGRTLIPVEALEALARGEG